MTGARLLVGVLLIVAALLPRAALAQPRPEPSARALEHFGRGVVLFNARDYPAAANAFRAAYTAEARRDFLFAWAQAARLAGDCATAVPLYRKLLVQEPASSQAELIRASLARCAGGAVATAPPRPGRPPPPAPLTEDPRARADVAAATLPAVAPPPASAPSPTAAASHAPGTHPWYRDPLGGVLVAGGVAAVAASVGLFVAASRADDSASAQSIYRDYAHYADEARARRVAAWVTLGVGGALVVAGVLRYLLRGPRRPRADTGWQLDRHRGGLFAWEPDGLSPAGSIAGRHGNPLGVPMSAVAWR